MKINLKNWKTTLAGLVTGIALIVQGCLTNDIPTIVAGVGAILGGIASKDASKETSE